MSTDAEIERILRRARPRTSRAADRRILAAARAALADPPRSPSASRRRALAGAAAAAVVVAGALALWRGGEDGEPSVPPASSGAVRLGWVPVEGARATLAGSDAVLKLALESVAWDGAAAPSVVARVLDVLAGDETLAGRTIAVGARADQGDAARLGFERRSFLDVERAADVVALGASGAFLMALDRAEPAVDGRGRPAFVGAFGAHVEGTRVSARRREHGAAAADALARVRRELFAALDDADAAVRAASLSALRGWNGDGPGGAGAGAPADSFFDDSREGRALLGATHDRDPRVRWTAAWLIAPEAGEAGERALERLVFDPVHLVRQPAVLLLRERGARWLEPLEALADWSLDERTGPLELDPAARPLPERELASWIETLRSAADASERERAAWVLAAQGSSRAATDALIGALADPSVEVRRAAAMALGAVGGEGTVDALRAALEREPPRVAIRAAESLVLLGVDAGHAAIERAVRGGDARDATQALEIVARRPALGSPELLREALDDPRPTVRAWAVRTLVEVALASERREESAEADAARAALEELARDPEPLVRRAARVAAERGAALQQTGR